MSLTSISIFAQDSETVTPLRDGTALTDPPPPGFSPVSISKSEADTEASNNASKAGFTEAFFTAADLKELLSHSKAVGLRFYNAKEDANNGQVHLVAVAVQSDGSEINPTFSKGYRLSQPVAGGKLSVKAVNKSTAKSCVEHACNTSGLVPFTSFFPRSVLDDLMKGDATGLKLIPGSRKFTYTDAKGNSSVQTYNTMMAIGVSSEGNSLKDNGTQFYKSLEPCPYFCPNDKYLLMPARY